MIKDSTLSQSKLFNLNMVRLCKGGELYDELIARGQFKEDEAATIMRNLLTCVNYLH